MLFSTRSKLVFSFISVALLVGTVSLIVGRHLLYDSVLNEANNRIRQDLNVARVIYDDRVAAIQLLLETTGVAADFQTAVERRDEKMLESRMRQAALRLNLDFAGILMADGSTLCSTTTTTISMLRTDGKMSLADTALKQRRTVSGTVMMDLGLPGAEKTGLAIASAVPVMKQDEVTGIIYGGMLLHQDLSIVDKIEETVFRNEMYQGHNVGTATIFFNDLRISTNVLEKDGRRAIGTVASREVTQQVLMEGKNWTDRAFVVNDWYITAYEPIVDIGGNRVGMLYVGVLEAKYRDIRQKAIQVFSTIILAGVMFAIALGGLLASRIMRPVNQLIQASTEISRGNLFPDMGPDCQGDIGLLQKEFKKMTQALVKRDQVHLEESEKRLIQSEKQASIGKLAAGVAHEINNPLTPVLTFTHLILRRKDLPEEVRRDLEIIAFQTERVRRIVKGLLDFSRQSRLDREFLNPVPMLEECVRLMENQALIHGVTLNYTSHGELPVSKLDRNQIQSVMVNLILNALDATDPGGKIDLASKPVRADGAQGIEICVQDTGVGIAPEHIDKLFDPFFTTKEVGKGTGLGLAVSAGIIERHGGGISVKSEPGKGSLFTIWLPCDRDGEKDPKAETEMCGYENTGC
nr:two-component sensor histidine kinase [Desulfobacula sp.]